MNCYAFKSWFETKRLQSSKSSTSTTIQASKYSFASCQRTQTAFKKYLMLYLDRRWETISSAKRTAAVKLNYAINFHRRDSNCTVKHAWNKYIMAKYFTFRIIIMFTCLSLHYIYIYFLSTYPLPYNGVRHIYLLHNASE